MDAAAAAFFAGHGEAPTARLYPVPHTAQAVAVGCNLVDIKSDAVVVDFDGDVASHILQADDDLSRLGVFADVGQRLLHQAIHGQLGSTAQIDVLKIGGDGQARALFKLASQNFKRCLQAEVRQRRWPQVFNNAAFQGNAAV